MIKKTYYWMMMVFCLVLMCGTKTVHATSNLETDWIKNVTPKITYCKRIDRLGVKIKWKKIENADGYIIYCARDYDDESNYVMVDLYDPSSYKVVKKIEGTNTTEATFGGLMNGATYTYRVCAYVNVNEKKKKSQLSSEKSVLMDYYSYDNEYYEQRIKRAFGSERKMEKNFKTAQKAAKQMKTIKIRVWDFENGKQGKKITKIKYITVNKRLAPSIQQLFNDLYKSKEKQVIKDIGCYAYRTGEHMYGMAIDINPNENYMIDGKKILCGSYWKPKKDPYSIPRNCELVRIMKRYGFYRGEWGNRKDYMHFSYFGT
ncbi:MAG: M15 family metallopeptidase [Eubacteriales bacterium]|nr:M15 family metallopeptidase [Eubacteriales bacterium]